MNTHQAPIVGKKKMSLACKTKTQTNQWSMENIDCFLGQLGESNLTLAAHCMYVVWGDVLGYCRLFPFGFKTR